MKEELKKIFLIVLKELSIPCDPLIEYELLRETVRAQDLDMSFDIYYSGSGDSGDTFELQEIKGGSPINWRKFDSIEWGALADIIDYDWYNNEGGFGNITISLSDMSISVDGDQRTSEPIQDTTDEL